MTEQPADLAGAWTPSPKLGCARSSRGYGEVVDLGGPCRIRSSDWRSTGSLRKKAWANAEMDTLFLERLARERVLAPPQRGATLSASPCPPRRQPTALRQQVGWRMVEVGLRLAVGGADPSRALYGRGPSPRPPAPR